MAYSGRCLLSGYFNHRDANQGTCTNACRWDYKVGEGCQDATGDISVLHQQPRHPLANRTYLLEEAGRPGQLMPIFEDEHGTYIMNSKDLRAVEHVERLVKIGITSLKVEGRTKSAYYAARTAQVYRQAIDDAVAGRPFDESLLGQLQGLANRGYTDGFYQRHHTQEHQNYMRGASETDLSQYVGDVLGIEDGWARIDVKNHFAVGDRIEVMHPGGNRDITIDRMQADDGSEITIAPGSGHIVRIQLDAGLDGALLSRYF
jgi:putative protease